MGRIDRMEQIPFPTCRSEKSSVLWVREAKGRKLLSSRRPEVSCHPVTLFNVLCPMRILALETSGRGGSVALLHTEATGAVADAIVLQERLLDAAERPAKTLHPCVKSLLDEQLWRPRDVELICVAVGPGSFTGLRIGVVAAKTLAYATGAKLAAIPTLAAIAEGVGPIAAGERLWTVLDAQRQELFVASFGEDDDLADGSTAGVQIMPASEWLAKLSRGDVVAGPPIEKLLARLSPSVVLASPGAWNPAAASVGRLGYRMAQRGRLADPLALLPFYCRQSAAEEKAAAKG